MPRKIINMAEAYKAVVDYYHGGDFDRLVRLEGVVKGLERELHGMWVSEFGYDLPTGELLANVWERDEDYDY